ncbi:hypothetical protein A2159_01010 [Candidatus Woesebacteria bacterium RBG_13_34_9]|uniref:Uncharacterized protein n=1 Tax=Candidatus Woesebacteria bacterium RBG_13_34_9 TaxID=1802477 RepID=A0A1F7X334_9BACT|nr:MAG: hypothetical protein A2159_01010 [Candidatus Woesebacteria bacterium RBG_13_34_9]
MKLLYKLISPETMAFLRFSAIAGLLTTTTLLVNLNKKTFNNIFQQRSKSLWWVFLFSSILPLLLFLYIFNFLFGEIDMLKEGKLVLKVFGLKY